MRRFQNWIFLALLGLLFIEIWLGFPIKLENKDTISQSKNFEATTKDQVDQKMQGVHLVESRGGDRDWELFAEAAEGFEGKGKWQISKVKINFYSETQKQFQVIGDRGEIDSQTKDMKIEGHVVTTSMNGYRFESNLLLYLAKDRLLQSPSLVRMSTPPDSEGSALNVTSDFMRASVDRSEVLLVGHVLAEKKMKSNHQVKIQSHEALFSGLNYLADFREQVSIQYDQMKLESPKATFQYKTNSSLLDFIQLGGGVKLSDADRYGTAEAVRIEPETNRIVLTGNPRVIIDQDEIMGEKIIFIDGGKKVKIEKMKARVENTN